MSKLKENLTKAKEVANQKIKDGDYINQAKSMTSDVVSDISSMKQKSPKSIIQIINKNMVLKIVAIVILIILVLLVFNILGGDNKAQQAEKIAKVEAIQDYKSRNIENPKISAKCIAKNSDTGLYAIDITGTWKTEGDSFKDGKIVVIQLSIPPYDAIDSRIYADKNDRAATLDSVKESYELK